MSSSEYFHNRDDLFLAAVLLLLSSRSNLVRFVAVVRLFSSWSSNHSCTAIIICLAKAAEDENTLCLNLGSNKVAIA